MGNRSIVHDRFVVVVLVLTPKACPLNATGREERPLAEEAEIPFLQCLNSLGLTWAVGGRGETKK